jgi:aspartyl-tRNA(Asn)/glutamyl-tRNA(Gln) amidotransferase subunit C
MSMVSKEEIRALGSLARLQLTESEIDTLQSELSGILEHMEMLNEVDTSGVAPMTHVDTTEQALRSDEIAESLDRDRILAAAHRTEDDCFAVPSILPGGSES